MITLGTLVADEVILPISRIYLARRRIMVEAHAPGPVRIAHGSEVKVHDPEGGLVTVIPLVFNNRRDLVARKGQTAEVTLEITATGTGWPT